MQTGRNSEDFSSVKDWIKVNGYEDAPAWIIKDLTGYDLRLIKRAQEELNKGSDIRKRKKEEEAINKLLAQPKKLPAQPKPWRIL